jgi:hypothetical protein
MASDVFPLARHSKYLPNNANVISITIVSKYVVDQNPVSGGLN